MKTERDLVLEYYGCTEVDEIGRAKLNGKWVFITDLTVKYRREQKTKKSRKISQQKIREEFKEKYEELVSEVENYCNDLFSDFDDVVVFINRTSVNVFDPQTQTTAYCLLGPSTSCVNIDCKHLDTEKVRTFINKCHYQLAKTQKDGISLINGLKDTKEVAECIFEILTKLRYEID